MKHISLIIAIVLNVCFLSTTLYAQTDSYVTLGGQPVDGQIKIEVFKGGCFYVTRYSAAKKEWVQQFYDKSTTTIFSIKIGDKIYSSSGGKTASGTILHTTTLHKFDVIEDVGTAVTVGPEQEVTKRFNGNFNDNKFSVTIKISYNTNTPEFFTKDAIIDATNIPLDTPISFAYGFDTFLAADDAGFAFVMPDIFGLNNSQNRESRYLTTEQVQSLRLVGARNNASGNAIIAYYTMGRNFDRAFSAMPYRAGHSYNILQLTPGDGTDVGPKLDNDNQQYKLLFGPYANVISSNKGDDNAQGVGYDNIPAGEITEIKTGLTFTTSLEGELNYYWNNEKNYSAQIGEIVNLNLKYKSYSNTILDDVGFRVDFEGLHIDESGCSSSGFTGETETCVPENEYYEIIDAEVAALGSATVNVPIKITHAGQWQIDNNVVIDIAHTFPLGAPAVLTVPTTVSLTDNKPTRIFQGETKTYTIKFPDNATAAEDVTINLTYYGDMDAFSSMPATLTIPAGSNSVSFQVTALPNSESNSAVLITLSSTDKAFASIVEPSSNMLTIEYESVEVEFCLGKMITFVANPTNGGDAPTYQWKKNGINIQGETNYKFAYIPQVGDIITCEMTTNATCPFPTTVLSQKMIMVACTKAWVSGTVFPFNHYGEVEFDTLFHVVASLYDIELLSQGPTGILSATPIYTDTAVYYNGSTFIPNTPKYPGYLGRTSNPGTPINWGQIRTASQERNNTFLQENELPESNIGRYSFDNILQGEYILVLTKEGYFPRFAKINISEEKYLIEHRELVPGYFNENFTVDENTLSKILENISRYDRDFSGYNPKYDINGDLRVDMTDLSILKFYLGFHWLLYEDTFECFEQP